MPDVPVGNEVIAGAFTNTPVGATPTTQLYKQLDADISVANIAILLRLIHPENIY